MSKHSLKSRRRHPNAKREDYPLAHITFQICPDDGTFGLFAGHPEDSRGPLFSGFIKKGMGTALRRIAHRFDDLEPKETDDE